jgi:peroxiredoxin
MQLSGWIKTFSLVFGIAILLSFLAVPAGAVNLHPGDKAPNFTLTDIDGKRVTLDQYRGKTVIIAFWSTWCSRCEEELVFLRDTVGKRDDVVVLLVNQDSEKTVPLARILQVKERLGIEFPILIDEGLALWENFGINALPTSVVVDGNGNVKLVETNFYWASPDHLLAAIGQS